MLTAFVAASCNQSILNTDVPPQVESPSDSSRPAHPVLAVLSLKETYNQAETIALNWSNDAQLEAVDFDIELGSTPDKLRVSYAFLSSASHNFLLVFVSESQGEYHLKTVEDSWPADRPIGTAIVFDEIKLESKEALQAVMKNGGTGFFQRYIITRKEPLNDFNLGLERSDEYNGEGPLIWTGGFAIDNPHAQLYLSVEDASGDLLRVKAYGEQEQEYWFRDIAVRERILAGDSKRFFDLFDLRLDSVKEEASKTYANFTIISPETPWLISGQLTEKNAEEGSEFYFGDYVITLLNIDAKGIEVKVMPIVRWYNID